MLKRKPLATALALVITASAYSQTYAVTESANSDKNEIIIVTGSRIQETLDEVPASVIVINNKQIEQQLKVSSELQSLLASLVPGMAPNTGSTSNSSQTLRGRAPLIMIDGVPQSTPLRNGSLGVRTLDASAIERIEVIKGATSIYGNGAAGGIINYITKNATTGQTLTGKASLSSRFSAVKLEDNAGSRFEGAIDSFTPFISYSQGADISDTGRLLRTATVTDISLIRTEASIIESYEVGFTSQFDSLRLEFPTYRSTSELGTSTQFDPETGVFLPVRAPQKIWGYEGLATYNITSNLDFTATYSWVEGKDREKDVYLGTKNISAPKATMQLSWYPSDNAYISTSPLYVGSRKRFDSVGGIYLGDQGPISSYQVVNLNGQYDINNKWSTYFGIENLFNQDYYPAKSQGYTYPGYNHKGLGSTINIGVNYQF